ncbi:hypothetical protein BRADI_3g16400v3 [Brachypodium distachyon]|uniref:Zinc finger LSD1-type domain-containing protein n=1 Tax=Brachypodium distachyon TaxID=15368 RepID=A0A0Q3LS35_BRADI|nr:hypothetical protein BRADI_3g16400v3 [Brachypodium distachyon]
MLRSLQYRDRCAGSRYAYESNSFCPSRIWTEMAQLVCGGCHTLLMYIRGATSVQCSCCHTVNLAMEANQVAHVNCGNCRMLLMYQYGARSVKCAVCSFVTSVGATPGADQKSSN